jgi:predicted NBD/HSP70 family sugar kinase
VGQQGRATPGVRLGDLEGIPVGIAIDIGGTTFSAGVVGVPGKRIALRAERDTGRASAETSLAAVISCVNEVEAGVLALNAERLGRDTAPIRVVSYGVGSPGPLGSNGSYVVSPILGWDHFPLRERLIDALVVSPTTAVRGERSRSQDATFLNEVMFIGNDANVAALGVWAVSGKPDKSLLLFTLSTGFGGGLVLPGGHLLEGDTGNAVEIGHVAMGDISCDYEHGPCLVGSVAGWAIEQRFEIEPRNAPYVVRQQIARELGRGLSIALHAYDVHTVVAMGSVALGFQAADLSEGVPAEKAFLATVRDAMRSASLSHLRGAVVVPSPLGSDTGLFGAGVYGLQRVGLLGIGMAASSSITPRQAIDRI